MKNLSSLVLTLSVLVGLGFIAWRTSVGNQALAVPHVDDAAAIELAQETTDGLISGLISAVVEITTSTAAENVIPNSQALSLLLPECQNGYRLLDGTGEPLDPKNQPLGRFEVDALEAALAGETTQIVEGNKLRTVVPLPFAAENCALCHTNYLEFEPDD